MSPGGQPIDRAASSRKPQRRPAAPPPAAPTDALPAIDADIQQASALPGRAYSDPALYQRQRQLLFARSWQLVGDVGAIDSAVSSREHGWVHPVTLLGSCLDEPLLLTRDPAGRLHCLPNVCTHRGNILVEQEGAARGLRCRYHGRHFDLDGRCTGSPEFDGVPGFPTSADHLAPVATGRFGPLLFASLDPAQPFEEWIAPARQYLAFLSLDGALRDATASRPYEVAANWALYCDNYLEGLHIPFVHPGLAPTLDWRQYRTELQPSGSLQVGIAAAGQEAFDLPPEHPHSGQRVAAYWLWLFPNLMLNLYPWGLSVNVVEPLAVDRSRIHFTAYVVEPSLRTIGAGGDLHTVELQDERVVESVQRGVRSRLYRRGRYCPTQERGVHHFHRMLVQALAG